MGWSSSEYDFYKNKRVLIKSMFSKWGQSALVDLSDVGLLIFYIDFVEKRNSLEVYFNCLFIYFVLFSDVSSSDYRRCSENGSHEK
jgi:hypothetical protein